MNKVVFGLFAALLLVGNAFARDLDYNDEEISIRVTPGEPTQVQFPGEISGGFRKKLSSLSLERKDEDLIVFSNESITETGEAIIVRLKDGRSYSVRVQRASDEAPRDDVVKIFDQRGSILASTDEESAPYDQPKFNQPPASTVSGLMREMMLVNEFGKEKIPGYRVSDRYKGETVLNDGTMRATIEKIFVGGQYWGYVIKAANLMDQSQRINPATFRLDGTRAISLDNWELAPRPLNIEQQIAGKDVATIYVITKARN
ncbi:MAG: type-F conjugative transfer system secretin TraK [Bdellovibrionales bacterium]|nr:type-F conjugative transfer system secretin TraK [Bdellovibrionales bacterium]